MIQLIIGAAAGAAGMWAYQKWFGEPDDDDWDTGVWDQPTTSYPSTPATSDSGSSSSPSTDATPSTPTSGSGAAASGSTTSL